jgi:hypothetical protein
MIKHTFTFILLSTTLTIFAAELRDLRAIGCNSRVIGADYTQARVDKLVEYVKKTPRVCEYVQTFELAEADEYPGQAAHAQWTKRGMVITTKMMLKEVASWLDFLHEFGHFRAYYAADKNPIDWGRDWSQSNYEEFPYGELVYKHAQFGGYFWKHEPNNFGYSKGFITAYAATSPAEDIAEMYAYVMAFSGNKEFWHEIWQDLDASYLENKLFGLAQYGILSYDKLKEIGLYVDDR